ncbi:TPA: A24 family peptidase [Serratia marcescens]
MTQPLLWGGLLCNLDARWAPLDDAVIGAAAGYGALWLLNALYRQLRRRNGIGQGDFKLLAALGAWLGWTMLPLLVCLAAMFGLGMALARGLRNRRAWRTPQPFGIALAAAGWLLLLMNAGQNAPALFGEFFSVSISRLSNPATSAVLAVAGLASGRKP